MGEGYCIIFNSFCSRFVTLHVVLHIFFNASESLTPSCMNFFPN